MMRREDFKTSFRKELLDQEMGVNCICICSTSIILVLVFGINAACNFNFNHAQDVNNCSSSSTPQLSTKEVAALKQIAQEVGKFNWNCSENPCTSINNTCWRSENKAIKKTNLINCTCEHDGKWHVSRIYWKGLNLRGVLPKSLNKLSYIRTIDLSRNFLKGPIPSTWNETNLEVVSLFANQLTGPIPKFLGDIVTLTQLSLMSNKFNGTIPSELGNLTNLMNLTLSDNKLTGTLPSEFEKLSKLTTFLISSNNFSGKLPDKFQYHPELQYLDLTRTGFEGPIPSSISNLMYLKILQISDLDGEGSEFPQLLNLTKLINLVLRNCIINGSISKDVGYLRNIQLIDLSFNNLRGSVPNIPVIKNLYLTGNMLNGSIPCWMVDRNDTNSFDHIDLSYNKFNAISQDYCDRDKLNLYRCDAKEGSLDSSACLRDTKCSKARYSLHINCGGYETKIRRTTYEQDTSKDGIATFFRKNNWGFSSSGVFGKDFNRTNFTAHNSSMLIINEQNVTDTELYKDARVAATSLTYYGRCLAKGNYTITLHFSEIVFSDYLCNLGARRAFDIYIQGKLYVKDFDIVAEANGTNKPCIKVFQKIQVNDSIEIRFNYAGNGSTQIPLEGNYGPLISAISVVSEFGHPFPWKKVIQVLIGATLCSISIALVAFWWKRRLAIIQSREQELRVLNPQIGIFTYKQIKAACNNFDAASKLGEGGFGSVYKGTLLDGTNIAVKQLSAKSSQGNKEFLSEIGTISSLSHPNLVKLYGCSVDTGQLFLVYEYLENKDLGHALFGSDDDGLSLDWPTRKKICIGIARGLAFLHDESRKIVHRDIKVTNVLLDHDLNPKISDFGLARLNEEDITHISTRIAGTIGYMAPEYALWGYLTPKADLYSFGVVILEVVAGRCNMKFQADEDHFCLLDWAFVQKQKGNLTELIDPRLETNYNKEEASAMIQVALLCTNPSPTLRPTMSEALNMLEGKTKIQELILEPNSSYSNEWMYQAFANKRTDQTSESETQSLIHSSGAPRTGSSSSKCISQDLYPVDAALSDLYHA